MPREASRPTTAPVRGAVLRGDAAAASGRRLLMEATGTDTIEAAIVAALSEPRPRADISGKPTQFLIPDALKERLRERAHVERRSMSELAREALQQYLDRQKV